MKLFLRVAFLSAAVAVPGYLTADHFLLDCGGCCDGTTAAAACTGADPCPVCKNCEYCKYCNEGGSCGTCKDKEK